MHVWGLATVSPERDLLCYVKKFCTQVCFDSVSDLKALKKVVVNQVVFSGQLLEKREDTFCVKVPYYFIAFVHQTFESGVCYRNWNTWAVS